jgi:hypothetical protein
MFRLSKRDPVPRPREPRFAPAPSLDYRSAATDIYTIRSASTPGVVYEVTVVESKDEFWVHCTCPHGKVAHRRNDTCKHARAVLALYYDRASEVGAVSLGTGVVA